MVKEGVRDDVKSSLENKKPCNPFNEWTHLHTLFELIYTEFTGNFSIRDICSKWWFANTLWNTLYRRFNDEIWKLGVTKQILPLWKSGGTKWMYVFCNPDEQESIREEYLLLRQKELTDRIATAENPFKRKSSNQTLFGYFQKKEWEVVLYNDLIELIGENDTLLFHRLNNFNTVLKRKWIVLRVFSFWKKEYERWKYVFCRQEDFDRIKAEYLFENWLEITIGRSKQVLGYDTLRFTNITVQKVYDFFLARFWQVVSLDDIEEEINLWDVIFWWDILRWINLKLKKYWKAIKSMGMQAGARWNYVMCDLSVFPSIQEKFLKTVSKNTQKTSARAPRKTYSLKIDNRPWAILKRLFYDSDGEKSFTEAELISKLWVDAEKLWKAIYNLNNRHWNEVWEWIVKDGNIYTLTKTKPQPKRAPKKVTASTAWKDQSVELRQERGNLVKVIWSSEISYNPSTLELTVWRDVWYIDEEPMKTLVWEYIQSKKINFPFDGSRSKVNEFCSDMWCPFYVTNDWYFIYTWN